MNIHTTKELSALVRSSRKAKQWTQAELAEKVGVKPLWISQFENGKDTAQIGLVLRTLRAVGVSLQTSTPAPPNESTVDLDDLLESDQ